MAQARAADAVPIQVQVTGERAPDIAEYAQRQVRSVFRYTGRPILAARVRVTRRGDPAGALPVTAQATLDVNGRPVRAQVRAATAREAVDALRDRLQSRLRRVLDRAAGTGEARRGASPSAAPHEWRHRGVPPARPPYYPRPPEEREIVRHKSFTLASSDLDEAAFDMESLDYDFHLFTELGSGQDSVLYRTTDGYRLAQVDPRPEALARHAAEVTVSPHPASELSTAEAVAQMRFWDRPFLFFLDAERGRGALLYHRYDGHYGLISPADQ